MLIQHVKGYADPSIYIKNKGGITLDTDRETPCSWIYSCVTSRGITPKYKFCAVR